MRRLILHEMKAIPQMIKLELGHIVFGVEVENF